MQCACAEKIYNYIRSVKCLKCQYILILVAGNTKEQLEFHLKQQNRIWLDMGVSWNRTIPMVFYKRDISVIWPIKINHLFLSYSLCWVESMQCSVPGRQCCQCWPRVTAWQWHVCDTSRPEYEASCQVSRVTRCSWPYPHTASGDTAGPAVDI